MLECPPSQLEGYIFGHVQCASVGSRMHRFIEDSRLCRRAAAVLVPQAPGALLLGLRLRALPRFPRLRNWACASVTRRAWCHAAAYHAAATVITPTTPCLSIGVSRAALRCMTAGATSGMLTKYAESIYNSMTARQSLCSVHGQSHSAHIAVGCGRGIITRISGRSPTESYPAIRATRFVVRGVPAP